MAITSAAWAAVGSGINIVGGSWEPLWERFAPAAGEDHVSGVVLLGHDAFSPLGAVIVTGPLSMRGGTCTRQVTPSKPKLTRLSSMGRAAWLHASLRRLVHTLVRVG